jgi:hypothetical protein
VLDHSSRPRSLIRQASVVKPIVGAYVFSAEGVAAAFNQTPRAAVNSRPRAERRTGRTRRRRRFPNPDAAASSLSTMAGAAAGAATGGQTGAAHRRSLLQEAMLGRGGVEGFGRAHGEQGQRAVRAGTIAHVTGGEGRTHVRRHLLQVEDGAGEGGTDSGGGGSSSSSGPPPFIFTFVRDPLEHFVSGEW